MNKRYFWDESLTIFLRRFSSSFDFPVFKIGLFQNGFFKKIEAMSSRYFLDEPLTNFFKRRFSSSYTFLWAQFE